MSDQVPGGSDRGHAHGPEEPIWLDQDCHLAAVGAARGLSRYGYGNLMLEEVAREAGYTRGALYHQPRNRPTRSPSC